MHKKDEHYLIEYRVLQIYTKEAQSMQHYIIVPPNRKVAKDDALDVQQTYIHSIRT
jgi:hypothetical protein